MTPASHDRANPTTSTKRQLYLLSGNCCAYPGCQHRIIDERGNFVAQICHIRAAMPGGERYDENMTNDERAHADNLMLMCYDHHIRTNDVIAYPTERLHSFKREHEDRYRAGLKELEDITDLTREHSYTPPTHMTEFLTVTGNPLDDLSEDEIEEIRNMVRSVIDQFRSLSRPARQVMSIVVDRGEPARLSRNEDLQMLLSELPDVVGATPGRVSDLVLQLKKRDFAVVDDEFDGIDHVITHLPASCGGWPTWISFKGYCATKEIPVDTLLVDLRFDFLD